MLKQQNAGVEAGGVSSLDPVQKYLMDTYGGVDYNQYIPQEVFDARNKWNTDFANASNKWQAGLPDGGADFRAHMQGHNDSITKTGKIIKPLALAAIAAAGMGAGGQALGLEGLFGGAGGGAAEGGGTGMLSEGGMFGLESLPFDQAVSVYSQLPTSSFNPFMAGGAGSAGAAGGTGFMLDGGMFSPEGLPFDQAIDFSSNIPASNITNPFTPAVATTAGAGLSDFVNGLLPGSAKEALKLTPDILKVAGSLGGMYSSNQQKNNLGNLASNLTGLYGPGSAYEEQLRKELMRRDAAAGRRSQYGPRAVELQARLAGLASGQAGTLANIYKQQNNSTNNMINSGISLLDQTDLLGKLGSLLGG